MKKKIIYQVNFNLSDGIIEREYFKKTDKSIWFYEGQSKCALDDNYHRSFDNKEEAIEFQERLIKDRIDSAQSSLNHYNEMLLNFQAKYKSDIK